MSASATSPRSGNYRDQTAYTTTGYATGDTTYPYRVSPFTAGYYVMGRDLYATNETSCFVAWVRVSQ